MSSFASLGALAAKFATIATEMHHAEHAALEEGAQIIEDDAKALIGTYTAGWPALKAATIARKARGDTPLLETGALQNSIEHTVQGDTAWIGTNDRTAEWMEYGTSRGIPPRPFMGSAAERKGDEVARRVGGRVVRPLLAG